MLLLAVIISLAVSGSNCSYEQDSLPPLHTLQDKDISSVSSSFPNVSIIIVLKNDSVLVYPHASWDFEDFYPSTPRRISAAIKNMEKTFTQTEIPAQFPGGADSLNAYVKRFCKDHRKDIEYAGQGDVMISFIVHLKGQRCLYSPYGLYYSRDRADLALKCLTEGPDWMPAVQNGRKVTAYASATIHLSKEK